MAYSDGDNDAASSHSYRSHRSGRSAPRADSYTDRFRADAPVPQPSVSYRSGSGHGRSDTVSIPQILAYIDRATSARLREPDLALNLQIADAINEKKGTAPREAAMKIVSIVNSHAAHQSPLLALSVLDVCVKNCGYAFHLQISRRDFLNKLVRSFPEKPPLKYSRVQIVILELIEEWTESLCRTSKHKDDFGFIRDMHRLLSYKGYMFPEIDRDELSVLNTPEQDALKSAAELEREDREAQSAKLQELIRSGTPADLKEANRLMSVMAGFREAAVDYRAKVAAELDKVRGKADVLAEMLDSAQQAGSGAPPDDVMVELGEALKAAMPKLSRILKDEEDAGEDAEAVERITKLQAYVRALTAKYDLVRSGDMAGAASVHADAAGTGTVTAASRQAAIDSLIDIGDDTDPGSASASASAGGAGTSASGADDLLGLSFGGLTLGGAPPSSTADILALGAPAAATSTPASPAAATPAAAMPAPTSPAAASPAAASPAPAQDDLFGDLISSSTTASPGPTPDSSRELYADATLAIRYAVAKQPGETTVDFVLSNPGNAAVENVQVQLAPPKSLAIELGPLSGTRLKPHEQRGIRQTIVLRGQAAPKLRWRVLYTAGGEPRTAGGDLKSL